MSEIIREGRSTAADAPGVGPGRTGAVASDAPPPPSSPVTAGEKSSPVGLMVLVGLLVFAGISGGISLVIVILSLVVMIFMHELGHYLAARHGGMKATEFFIGFGPKLWSFKRGETEFGFKGIPLGAYVRIIGMSNLEEVDPEDEPRTYRQQSYPKRLLVAVAGSGMHFLMALVLLYTVLITTGSRSTKSRPTPIGPSRRSSRGVPPRRSASRRAIGSWLRAAQSSRPGPRPGCSSRPIRGRRSTSPCSETARRSWSPAPSVASFSSRC